MKNKSVNEIHLSLNSWPYGGTNFLSIVHFTVVCFGTCPLSGSEAGGDLVSIQTSCFSYVNANKLA